MFDQDSSEYEYLPATAADGAALRYLSDYLPRITFLHFRVFLIFIS